MWVRAWWWVVAASLGAGCAPEGIAPPEGPDMSAPGGAVGQACVVHDDCEPALRCTRGMCLERRCERAADPKALCEFELDGPARCAAGGCRVIRSGLWSACTSDVGCDGGRVCAQGRCASLCDGAGGCTDGACHEVSEDDAARRVCLPVRTCDEALDPHAVCGTLLGLPTDQVRCDEGRCEPARCHVPGHVCAIGERCEALAHGASVCVALDDCRGQRAPDRWCEETLELPPGQGRCVEATGHCLRLAPFGQLALVRLEDRTYANQCGEREQRGAWIPGVDLVAVSVRDALGGAVIGRAQVRYAMRDEGMFAPPYSYTPVSALDKARGAACGAPSYPMGCGGEVVMQLIDAMGAPLTLASGMVLTIERLDKLACGVTLEPREELLTVSLCASAPATVRGVGECVKVVEDDLADRVEVRIP